MLISRAPSNGFIAILFILKKLIDQTYGHYGGEEDALLNVIWLAPGCPTQDRQTEDFSLKPIHSWYLEAVFTFLLLLYWRYRIFKDSKQKTRIHYGKLHHHSLH
jgi:hypothetical protein